MPLRRAAGEIPRAGAILSRLGEALRAAGRIGATPKDGALRIGVDIRPFFEPLTGVGWYLAFLLEELARRDDIEIVCFGDSARDELSPPLHATLPRGLEPLAVDFRGLPPSAAARKAAAAAFPALAYLTACDLFFAPNYFLPRALSAAAKRRVITVHDLTYKRFPDLLQKETLANLEREMLREISRADAIVCVSEATRSDLLAFYPVDPRKVHAVLSGPPPSRPAAADALDLPARFILFVSTIEPRKNLDVLIEAFEKAKDRGYPGDLVVAGKVGWKSERALERIARSRWRASIRRLDYVERGQLPWLYRRADAFVLPSIYEGFGFPILEAMAEGTPVIAAENSSLPEVGGDAALYFPTGDAGALANAIETVTSAMGLRGKLRARGEANLARFSWERAAAETAAIFRRVAR
ncbi:MAG TPA: glycosyltransferase family 1 protein [Thermoanaerobaculia bacterium]|nr:glycosyltransferase family 1 protein [Thermoanaerobaculia bacterium]